MTTRRDVRERGAMLVLCAVLLVPLIMILALAIDLNSARAEKELRHRYLKLASLASLEAFNRAEPACYGQHPGTTTSAKLARLACKKRRSVQRFNEVAFDNVSFGSKSSPLDEDSGLRDGAKLIFGRWESSEELCGDGNTPCFKPLDGSQTAVTALRFEGVVYPSSPSIRFAQGVMGNFLVDPNLNVTAATVPRRLCVVADISASLASETHPRLASDHDEFAYALSALNGVASTQHDATWAALPATRPGGTFTPTQHYKDEYATRYTVGDSDYNQMPTIVKQLHPEPKEGSVFKSGLSGSYYKVDFLRNGGNSYDGPQPLADILEALHVTIDIFEERAVAGDKFCLIFYDDLITWNRAVKPTDNWSYLRTYTDFRNTGGAIVDDPVSPPIPLYNSARFNANPREHGILMGLFPRFNVNLNSYTYTDTYQAIAAAMNLLDEDSKENDLTTSDAIVAIGDGLGNCVGYMVTASDGTKQRISDCKNDFPHLYAAMGDSNGLGSDYYPPTKNGVAAQRREVWDLIDRTLSPRNVGVHWIYTGDHVQPHTYDIPKANGDCYTDKEFRSSKEFRVQSWVDDVTGYPNDMTRRLLEASPSAPYTRPGIDLYRLSVLGKGYFVPLRDPDTGCVGAERKTCPGVRTKRTLDPYCRSKKEQMKQAFREVLGDNPYVVVQIQ